MLFKKGSRGDDVKKIQQALNQQGGYGLQEDGIYGDKTAEAVTQYQQKTGIGVDGIVGSETWGKLFGGGNGTQNNAAATGPQTEAPAMQKTPMGTEYDPAKTTGAKADLGAAEGGVPRFEESQAYKDAAAALTAHQQNKPGEYKSPYEQRLNQIYEQVMSRGDFKYDFNNDPMYHLYRDQYMQSGKQAMQDAQAEAAALTGGYGNSYAAAAGNLAYQQHLNGINNVIPELYNQAYQEWLNGGDLLMRQLQTTQGMDETAYNRYRDQTGDYYTDLEYLTGTAQDAYNKDRAAYQDAADMFLQNRNYYYGKTQDEQAQQNYENEQALAMAAAGGGSGGSGGGSKSGSTGSPGKSAAYNDVLKTAQEMSKQNAYDYVGRMIATGQITQDEGDYILAVKMGLDLDQYSGGGEEETGNDEKNYDLIALRRAIEQIATTEGMESAASEVEYMTKQYGLTQAERQTLLSDAYQNRRYK